MEPHLEAQADYFILKQEWTLPSRDKIPRGSLWKSVMQDNIPMLVLVSDASDATVSMDGCPRKDFEALAPVEYDLLLAVKEEDRFEIHQTPAWLDDGRELQVGDEVTLQNTNHLPPETHGIIKFKGHPVEESPSGILFGIELGSKSKGQGSSCGKFRRRQFFECEENCAVFYSLKYIRRRTIDRVDSVQSSIGDSLSLHSDPTSARIVSVPRPLEVGEDVIWFSDHGPEKGTVRWIGDILTLDPHHKGYAGVEFENPIGKGTGRYKGKQLFQTKMKGHASLVPVAGLVRQSDMRRAGADQAESASDSYDFKTEGYTPDIFLPCASQLSTGPLGNLAMQVDQQLLPCLKAQFQQNPSGHDDRVHQRDIWATESGRQQEAQHEGDQTLFKGRAQQQDEITPEGGSIARQMPNPRDTDGDIALEGLCINSNVLKVGDRVLVPPYSKQSYGVIRWLGTLGNDPGYDMMAGVEMDFSDPLCFTDGTFEGKKFFSCEPDRAFFIFAEMCKRA